tara:strand:- start:772 stop:903 length:132 start_codon:yes stop_codon:yes gene_type:complete
MKKYLLLIEDEKVWEQFKESKKQDLNTEILQLIRERVRKGGKS